MTVRLLHAGTTCPALLVLLAAAAASHAQATAPGAAVERPASSGTVTHPHYSEALHVHDAVVRGDLAGAREAARRVGSHPESGLPEKAAPFAAALQEAAGRVAQAGDIVAAGASTAAMLGTCGECHRAVGAMPAVASRPLPAVGDTVGHMLAHQRASEQLLQGLIVPSTSAWNEGARALQTTPIARGKLPRDPKLTSDHMAGEKRLHELASRAAAAATVQERTSVYGEMIGTCAACHSLHPHIWGPGKP